MSVMVRPYIPWGWEGWSFKARAIAPVRNGAWVGETLLPLIVFANRRTGELSALARLDKPADAPGGIASLEADDHAVWAGMVGGLQRYDTATGAQMRIDGAFQVALSGGEAWALTPTGALGHIDKATGAVEVRTEVHPGRRWLAAGHGALWTLAFESPPSGGVIFRHDATSGAVTHASPVPGLVQELVVAPSSIVVRSTSTDDTRSFTTHELVIDPRSASILADDQQPLAEATFDGTRKLMHGGAVRIPRVDQDAGTTTLVRVDEVTGQMVIQATLPGLLAWWGIGPDAFWCSLQFSPMDPSGPPAIYAVDADTGAVEEYATDNLDVKPHLPPPPGPIDAVETERGIRDHLEKSFLSSWIDPSGEHPPRPFIAGITVDSVELQGRFPQTVIVVFFHADSHPGVRFGRRQRIWADDGALTGFTDCMDINLMEDIEACGYGLPPHPEVDEQGICWF